MTGLQTAAEQEIGWPPPPAGCRLDSLEAHVWACSLDVPEVEVARFQSLLAPEERERAARFRFDQHRNRFIAGRGLLRTILARYLEVEPGRIQLAYGPNGKPSLTKGQRGFQFNLAHSEDLALLAVTAGSEIGVDVERVRVLDDFDELVLRFFSRQETEAFRRLAREERPAAFFNLWTRKEAWLKATGEGIVRSLRDVEVSFLPGDPARFLRLPAQAELSRWNLFDLSPAGGFAGALATSGVIARIECWRWPEGEGT
jgi:4'-phosphopantetheinyl transferase